MRRHAGILHNAGTVALVTVPEAMPVALHGDDIAFIQYTPAVMA